MPLIKLLIFIADIWAIFQIVQSKYSPGKKTLWVVLVLILPVLGLVLWYLLGRKD